MNSCNPSTWEVEAEKSMVILDCIQGSECLRIQNMTPNLKKKKSLNWAWHGIQEGVSLNVSILAFGRKNAETTDVCYCIQLSVGPAG